MTEEAIVLENGTLRFERVLAGPIERVWAFLTEDDKRVRWLAGGHTEPRVDGQVELHFDHARLDGPREDPPPRYACMDETVLHSLCTVTRYEPPHVLAYTWLEGAERSEVTFELAAKGDQVRLILTHRHLGTDVDVLAGVAAGWWSHTQILEDILAGRPPRGFWSVHEPLEDRLRHRLSSQLR